MESASPTYQVNSVRGRQAAVAPLESGMADYYSVIFTGANSGIKRLEHLRGKTIVFEDPGSTSGYLMPKSLV